MRGALVIAVLVGLIGLAHANQPPERTLSHAWWETQNNARAAIGACDQRARAAGVFGEVSVQIDEVTRAEPAGRWTVTSSRSLGARGEELRACVKAALAAAWKRQSWDVDDEIPRGHLVADERLGTPRVLLPPAATMMPLWKRVVANDANAREQLEKLLPPDYTLRPDGCLFTPWSRIQEAEYLWLPSVGTPVPRIWNTQLTWLLGRTFTVALWDPAGAFVLAGERGTCLAPFDGAKQARLRTAFDTAGACWVGGFSDVLLHPRVAFPAATYAEVQVSYGRACAVTTTGAVTCCGSTDRSLPPAPKPVHGLALGYGFACGLDDGGGATCWGRIATPPPGPFTKLAAGYDAACGLAPDGKLACWGNTTAPPAGPYVDVSFDDRELCAARRDGAVTCWRAGNAVTPAGTFTKVAGRSCGLRADRSIGCWSSDGRTVDTPLAGAFEDVIVGGARNVCGRRDDDTVACAGGAAAEPGRIAPAGTFTTLAGHRELACGVRPDHSVACFGVPWPGSLGDSAWTWPQVLGLAPATTGPFVLDGRIVDEHGAPIAGAEVLVCGGRDGCGPARRAAVISSDALAQIVARLPRPLLAPALVRTRADGRWRITLANPVDDDLEVIATAPGREVASRKSSRSDARASFAAELPLRPASPIDLVPTCADRPCGTLFTRLALSDSYEGTHLERLPPGAYTLELQEEGSRTRHAGARVDVTYTVQPQRISIALPP